MASVYFSLQRVSGVFVINIENLRINMSMTRYKKMFFVDGKLNNTKEYHKLLNVTAKCMSRPVRIMP